MEKEFKRKRLRWSLIIPKYFANCEICMMIFIMTAHINEMKVVGNKQTKND